MTRTLARTTVRIKMTEEKIKEHWEELWNERRYLREFRYKWTKRFRADWRIFEWCTGRFQELELKAGMNNYEMMGSGESNWKTPEFLRMGEKNSHNRKQLWEDGIKLAPRIFKRTDMIAEKLFFGLQMLRMTMRNTTMNCWDTPGEWKAKRLSQ